MDLNYELLKVFYSVAVHLSFSEASRELFISQSAVSQSIKTLEQKLSTSLFIRNTKKVILTHEGQLLLEHVEPAFNLIQRGLARVLETNNLLEGHLHIGASDTICKYFLIHYFQKFQNNYPGIHLQVTNRTSTSCVDLLKQGAVDFILVNTPIETLEDSMEVNPVFEFHDVFIAEKRFLPTHNQALSLEELSDYPIMMLEKNTATSQFLYKVFEQAGLHLKPSIELGSNDLLIDMAAIGLGVAYVPDYTIRKLPRNLFVFSLKKELPGRKLSIVSYDKRPLSRAGRAFIQMLLSDRLLPE